MSDNDRLGATAGGRRWVVPTAGRRRWVVPTAAGGLCSLFAYHRFVRTRQLRWGATDEEVERVMPADELVRDPDVVTTRAVTIDAAPEDVWPWLAQLGDGRGGLYSYDWLDHLFGYTHVDSANRILSEHQHIAVGDVIPIGRGPDWPVVVADKHHALAIEPVAGRVTWCLAVYPSDGGTRLVSRVRARLAPVPLLWLAAPAVDLPWFVMERKMLCGIKERAERLEQELAEPTD